MSEWKDIGSSYFVLLLILRTLSFELITCITVDRLPYSCAELHEFYPEMGDGEFWLNVSQLNPTGTGVEPVTAKIYCHNMMSEPTEYLTLVEETRGLWDPVTGNADWKKGETVYNKLILQFPLRPISNDKAENHVFSVQLQGIKRVPFGTAHDCFSGSPKKGVFNIDLRGTGLSVHPAVEWRTYGYLPAKSITFSSTRQEVDGRCGGYCDNCGANQDNIYLVLREQDAPPENSGNLSRITEGPTWVDKDGTYGRRSVIASDIYYSASNHLSMSASTIGHCGLLCNTFASHCALFQFDDVSGICMF